MINIIVFSLILAKSSLPSIPSIQSNTTGSCCIDHINKPNSPLIKANYDCSVLYPFGKNRCNKVYGGGVCRWLQSKKCNRLNCRRVPKYEFHHGKFIDIGRCRGICKGGEKKCEPNNYVRNIVDTPNKLYIIKDCICDSCGKEPSFSNIRVSTDRCKGDCNKNQQDTVCMAGSDDRFSVINGLESSSPSPALVSGLLSGCSAGIQPGFDFFADNKCFGHTFTDCFRQGICPLRGAQLKICMKAANVFLTHTDSLVLGINGGGLWGLGLPILNGGTWNRGEHMCLDLNLANLPGNGANILLDIQMAGHLDVMVQDDTAVDFVTLSIQYDKCQKCIPKLSSVSHLYTDRGVTDYYRADDCDCIGMENCKRYDHFIVYYKGTIFENTVNVGQCWGNCPNNLRCNPKYKKYTIKAPEGSRYIKVVDKCVCGKLTWNPSGLFLQKE